MGGKLTLPVCLIYVAVHLAHAAGNDPNAVADVDFRMKREKDYPQFMLGTPIFDQEHDKKLDVLREQLRRHEDVIDDYYPDWRMITKDDYHESDIVKLQRAENNLKLRKGESIEGANFIQKRYTQNVIFDPCRGHAPDCCVDTYGEPEYFRPDRIDPSYVMDPLKANVELLCPATGEKYLGDEGLACLVRANGEIIRPEASRLSQEDYIIDESCIDFKNPSDDCIGNRARRQQHAVLPICWDHNDTLAPVNNTCFDVDGIEDDYCVALGYTQNSYIFECGGKFADDPHCGTFLEIHNPGERTVLSSVKLKGGFTSGYQMTTLKLFHGDEIPLPLDPWDPKPPVLTPEEQEAEDIKNPKPIRVLCKRKYELWWVIRTRYDFQVERKIPFGVMKPECDWDEVNMAYHTYYTLKPNEIRVRNKVTGEVIQAIDYGNVGIGGICLRVDEKGNLVEDNDGKGCGQTL